jgi:anti-sigma factor RsiW
MPPSSENCPWVQQRIEPYIDNELGDVERATLERHIDGCESCRRELRHAETVLSQLRTLPAHRCPERIIEDIASRAATVTTESVRARLARLVGRFDRRFAAVLRPALAVLLIVVVAASAVILRHDRLPDSRTAEHPSSSAVTTEELETARQDVLLAFSYVKKYNQRTGEIVRQEHLFNRVTRSLRKSVAESMFPFPLQK